MSGSLGDLLGAELARAIEEHVDARIRAAMADRDDGSGSPTWLSLDDAAAYLCVSRRTLARLLASGRIRSAYLGRRRLLHHDDLDAYLRGGGA